MNYFHKCTWGTRPPLSMETTLNFEILYWSWTGNALYSAGHGYTGLVSLPTFIQTAGCLSISTSVRTFLIQGAFIHRISIKWFVCRKPHPDQHSECYRKVFIHTELNSIGYICVRHTYLSHSYNKAVAELGSQDRINRMVRLWQWTIVPTRNTLAGPGSCETYETPMPPQNCTSLPQSLLSLSHHYFRSQFYLEQHLARCRESR